MQLLNDYLYSAFMMHPTLHRFYSLYHFQQPPEERMRVNCFLLDISTTMLTVRTKFKVNQCPQCISKFAHYLSKPHSLYRRLGIAVKSASGLGNGTWAVPWRGSTILTKKVGHVSWKHGSMWPNSRMVSSLVWLQYMRLIRKYDEKWCPKSRLGPNCTMRF